MPCDYKFSDQDVYIIAAYYQAKDKQMTTLKFRNNWVYQEDFLCDILIRNEPQDRDYIYVTEKNGYIVLSEMSSGEIEEEELFDHREYLKWEPNVAPDGNVFYAHKCMVCQEGMHREYAECMACGFCKEMLTNKSHAQQIVDDHYSMLTLEIFGSETWTL